MAEASSSSCSDWDVASAEVADATQDEEARLNGLLNARFVRKLAAPSAVRPTRRRPSIQAAYGASGQTAQAAASAAPQPTAASGAKRKRARLRDLLQDALRTGGSAESHTEEELSGVVAEIEAALKGMPEDSAEVAQGLVVNLSDPLNSALRAAVLSGAIPASRLVAMDEESLLNPELRAERQLHRKARLEQKTSDYIEQVNGTVTFMYKCPSCGGNECFAQFRAAAVVKWHGDDPNPTLLRCRACGHSFRA